MKKQKGFTLIELLVVIAIIGLLSTLAVVSLNNARAKSRDARRISDVKQLQTALEMYFNQNNSYPISSSLSIGGSTNYILCSARTGAAVGYSGFETSTSCDTSGSLYMKVPAALTPLDGGCASADNAYTYTGTASTYRVKYCLGATTGGINAGANTAYEQGISGGAAF